MRIYPAGDFMSDIVRKAAMLLFDPGTSDNERTSAVHAIMRVSGKNRDELVDALIGGGSKTQQQWMQMEKQLQQMQQRLMQAQANYAQSEAFRAQIHRQYQQGLIENSQQHDAYLKQHARDQQEIDKLKIEMKSMPKSHNTKLTIIICNSFAILAIMLFRFLFGH